MNPAQKIVYFVMCLFALAILVGIAKEAWWFSGILLVVLGIGALILFDELKPK